MIKSSGGGFSLVAATMMLSACAPPTGDVSGTTSAITSTSALPDGYVSTPVGTVYGDCVHQVPYGASIATNAAGNDVVSVNDVVVASYSPCTHPALASGPSSASSDTGGEPKPGDAQWKAWSYNKISGTSFFTEMIGTIYVPALPTNSVGQLIYIWPGLESNAFAEVLQPVLQYGWNTYSGGGDYWSMADWYLNASGGVYNTTVVEVGVGDAIPVEMNSETCNSSGVCWWDTSFTHGGMGYNLLGPTDTTFIIADTGVLESLGITNCDQYPAAANTTIRGVRAYYGTPSAPNARNSYTMTAGTSGAYTLDSFYSMCPWSSAFVPYSFGGIDTITF